MFSESKHQVLVLVLPKRAMQIYPTKFICHQSLVQFSKYFRLSNIGKVHGVLKSSESMRKRLRMLNSMKVLGRKTHPKRVHIKISTTKVIRPSALSQF